MMEGGCIASLDSVSGEGRPFPLSAHETAPESSIPAPAAAHSRRLAVYLDARHVVARYGVAAPGSE